MKKTRPSSFLQYFLLFVRGFVMGLADIVPGVSGGTIAFLTGIYEDLLQSIQSLNVQSFQLLFKGSIKKFFRSIAWEFLLTLL